MLLLKENVSQSSGLFKSSIATFWVISFSSKPTPSHSSSSRKDGRSAQDYLAGPLRSNLLILRYVTFRDRRTVSLIFSVEIRCWTSKPFLQSRAC
ncbi:hypothetical protein PoB_000656600 [Plakobranchus ocellatus]|uniref:Uncharacterized protein n=1 Tax=Plakobranchus ocellatus TaxID=259542 RepID=A0AAV3XYN7_9GAST|nr:hypothetical protein PoB_000656600 [Plakobranchus ocellatus]